MKQVAKTRLRKPIQEPEWELTEPEWMGESSVNFYIPIWFNPDEYIEGIQMFRNPYSCINIYLDCCLVTGVIEMTFVCKGDGYEFESVVELDSTSKLRLMNMIHRDWSSLLLEQEE